MVRSIKSVFIFLGLFITLFLYQNCAPTFQSSNLILNEEGFPSELNPLINDAPLLKTESKLLMNTRSYRALSPREITDSIHVLTGFKVSLGGNILPITKGANSVAVENGINASYYQPELAPFSNVVFKDNISEPYEGFINTIAQYAAYNIANDSDLLSNIYYCENINTTCNERLVNSFLPLAFRKDLDSVERGR